MRKFLLATDGSEGSNKAAYFLLDLVREIGEFEITVIHAINIRKEIYNYPMLIDVPEAEKIIQQQAGELIDETALIFENEGIQVKKLALDGDPGHEIVKYAKQNDMNQIIMGTRGLGNITGLVLGSVSQKVIHLAANPVTLVRS
ncbi:MAG: universal stress protein [Firmicutes bacterium]|nr:universal stress protein [Bacillota bacterium]